MVLMSLPTQQFAQPLCLYCWGQEIRKFKGMFAFCGAYAGDAYIKFKENSSNLLKE
jgi:hypothetical protein